MPPELPLEVCAPPGGEPAQPIVRPSAALAGGVSRAASEHLWAVPATSLRVSTREAAQWQSEEHRQHKTLHPKSSVPGLADSGVPGGGVT